MIDPGTIDVMTATDPRFIPDVLPDIPGRRICLRALRDDDAARLLDLYGDPVVMRYTDEDPFPDLATVALMLESVRSLLASGESLEWAITLKENDLLIGTCGLHSFDWATATAEVGCLLMRSEWGKHYMSEAVRLLMAYAADVLRLRRLRADVDVENQRAQRLFGSLGYRRADPGTWEVDLSS
ncbi:Protein N-acetyltransferase, RimJ/RimL family [Massilia sp. PDC64]|nr:GNAT family N-acetyltransferase [Massilia sp. PDC64]SDE95858.1 Protein N-acetyltransferase, RimJ/RimL family [Massilia sp. PDC64]